MTLYDALKFLHVLFAAIWVGTAAQQQFAASRAQATGDPKRVAEFANDAEFYGKRLFAPASGLAALFGVLLVIESGWEFTDAWIIIGIALFLVSSIVGAAFLTPESVRIKELVEQNGLEDPDVRSRIARINLVVRIDFLILVLIVADMVIKPGV